MGPSNDAKVRTSKKIPSKQFHQTEEFAQLQGFQLGKSSGDGNCFFHTLEHIINEPQNLLRHSIVTHMRVNQNLFIDLFTDEMKMQYFVQEAHLEERCQRMIKDKTWAGFPEKLSSSLFLHKNIFELYQSNLNFHWNVFFGSSEQQILEKNSLPNIFIHYDAIGKHFSPLTSIENVTPIIRIANIYCLLRQEPGNHGVFVNLRPNDLNPNHEMFQNMQQQQASNKPVGLENTGNTCFFSALIQSIYSLPIFMRNISLDTAAVNYENSFLSKLNKLLLAIDERDSEKTLRKYTCDVLHSIRQRFGEQFEANKQADPQELYLSMKMMIDEQLRQPNQITQVRNFDTLESYKENHEFSNRSKITKTSTIYNRVIRQHLSCTTENFEASSTLILQFNDGDKSPTTVEALMNKYVEKFQFNEPVTCSQCSSRIINMTQESVLENLPDVLVITIAR